MDGAWYLSGGIDWFLAGYIAGWFQKGPARGGLGARLHLLVIQSARHVGNQNFAQRHILADGTAGHHPLASDITFTFGILVTGEFISICTGLVRDEPLLFSIPFSF